jgi:hypothetical protein
MFWTVVSSHSQSAETRKLEDVITKPLPNNDRHHVAALTALLRLSGVMSHMLIWYLEAVSSASTISGFRSWDIQTETWTPSRRQQVDLISLLYLFSNKVNMLKHAVN